MVKSPVAVYRVQWVTQCTWHQCEEDSAAGITHQISPTEIQILALHCFWNYVWVSILVTQRLWFSCINSDGTSISVFITAVEGSVLYIWVLQRSHVHCVIWISPHIWISCVAFTRDNRSLWFHSNSQTYLPDMMSRICVTLYIINRRMFLTACCSTCHPASNHSCFRSSDGSVFFYAKLINCIVEWWMWPST